MPITLPNSGLVCPEQGDSTTQACEQIKALFGYVDTLPTDVDIEDNACVDLLSTSWVVEGNPDDKVFKQTITVPAGVNAIKSSMSVIDENGCVVSLCIEVATVSTICVFTNSPVNYSLVFG